MAGFWGGFIPLDGVDLSKQFADADKRLGKLTGRMEQIDSATKGLNAPEVPPAIHGSPE